jgi:hypothetical protein
MPLLEPGAGLQAGGIGTAFAVPGEEAEEAQDAQIVLADAGPRRSPMKRNVRLSR